MNTISAAEFRTLQAKPKASKYKNRKTVVDGITFDSAAEAAYYGKLKRLEEAGLVTDVQLQVPFVARGPKGELLCTYKADFVLYDTILEKHRVIDVKGFVTPLFKLKRKVIEALCNISIEIVK